MWIEILKLNSLGLEDIKRGYICPLGENFRDWTYHVWDGQGMKWDTLRRKTIHFLNSPEGTPNTLFLPQTSFRINGKNDGFELIRLTDYDYDNVCYDDKKRYPNDIYPLRLMPLFDEWSIYRDIVWINGCFHIIEWTESTEKLYKFPLFEYPRGKVLELMALKRPYSAHLEEDDGYMNICMEFHGDDNIYKTPTKLTLKQLLSPDNLWMVI